MLVKNTEAKDNMNLFKDVRHTFCFRWLFSFLSTTLALRINRDIINSDVTLIVTATNSFKYDLLK